MGEGCSPALPPVSKLRILTSLKWSFSSQSPQTQAARVGREGWQPAAGWGMPSWVERLRVIQSHRANMATAPIGLAPWGSEPAQRQCSLAPRETGTGLCLPHTSREAGAKQRSGQARPVTRHALQGQHTHAQTWHQGPTGAGNSPASIRPLFSPRS